MKRPQSNNIAEDAEVVGQAIIAALSLLKDRIQDGVRLREAKHNFVLHLAGMELHAMAKSVLKECRGKYPDVEPLQLGREVVEVVIDEFVDRCRTAFKTHAQVAFEDAINDSDWSKQ